MSTPHPQLLFPFTSPFHSNSVVLNQYLFIFFPAQEPLPCVLIFQKCVWLPCGVVAAVSEEHKSFTGIFLVLCLSAEPRPRRIFGFIPAWGLGLGERTARGAMDGFIKGIIQAIKYSMKILGSRAGWVEQRRWEDISCGWVTVPAVPLRPGFSG